MPLLIGLAALLRAVSQPRPLLNDPDTYLHIAAGRWILEHRALPFADPFSHTMTGASWVPHEWLSEIALAVVYGAGGWSGTVLLTAICFAVAIASLARYLVARIDPLPASIITIMAMGLLLPHLLVRPHILVLPFIAWWCVALFEARDRNDRPSFWLLPIMTVWANLHGSFIVGLLLAGFTAFEAAAQAEANQSRLAQVRRWASFLLSAAAASLLTPNGFDGFLQPFRLLAMPTLQSSFGEWASPSVSQVPALELWVLGTIGFAFLTGARLPATRVILLLGLLHVSFQHVRHIDLLAVVAPLALASPIGEQLGRLGTSPLTSWLKRLAMPTRLRQMAVAAFFAVVASLPTALHPMTRDDDAVTPGAAVAAVEQNAIIGPVFNEERFGGYLAYRGIPTFIDGRIEMFGDEFLATYLKAERGDEAVLKQLLERYRVEWTLLSPDAGAVAALDHLPGWRRVYSDTHAVVHRRIAGPENAASTAS